MCLYELSVVDDTLETLGAPKEYQQLRNWTIRIIIGWIVHISFYLAVYLYWMFLINVDIYFFHIYGLLLIGYPKFINILSAMIYGTILGLVYDPE